MMDSAAFTALITAKIRDASGELKESDLLAALTEALKCYSKHRPLPLCADIPGQDGADIPRPDDWAEGISTIELIEYPIGKVPESLIDSRDWRFYRAPSGIFIRFATITPASTEQVRVLYGGLHTEATLPVADEEAVANLAAAVCLRQMAARYGQTSDPTIGADVVNYRSKTDEFRRLAQAYEEAANAHLGIGTKTDTAPASVTAPRPDSKRVRLTHWRR
ncbi:hypothetical protein [Geobacter sp.]|uniref:hypothetical protein n=1 Tax=Geobacter sp. TaxID=46610 RepID=UPI002636457F|nr:hypothetical protein [Geobacter sp.]